MALSLDAAFDKAIDQVTKRVETVVKEIASTTFKNARTNSMDVGRMFGSPVLTGRFLSSHTISLNSPDTSVHPEVPKGQSVTPPPAEAEAAPVLAGYTLGDTIYISNYLDYAGLLEKGFSAKAPQGVYEVTAKVSIMSALNSLRGRGLVQ